MSADRDRVLKRVTEILNLVVPGTYSATLNPRNKTRNSAAIEDFVDEAGMEILTVLASVPNEFRYQFLADTSAITTSGARVPDHIGPPSSILITPYTGGTPVTGKQRAYDKIESYRLYPDLYDPDGIAHDAEGSSLSGLYDIWDDKFHFTGKSAVLSLARPPVNADTVTLIPDFLERVWVKLGVGNAEKVGTGGYETNLIERYYQKGVADLEAFKTGKRVFPEVDEPERAPVHTVG